MTINYTSQSCSVNIKLPVQTTTKNNNNNTSATNPSSSSAEYVLDLDPLSFEIVPSECRYAVMGTKVEIKLKKKCVGIKWEALETKHEDAVGLVGASGSGGGLVTSAIASVGVAGAQPPAYPSSSKKVSKEKNII